MALEEELNQKGECFHNLQRYYEAIEAFNTAIQIKPDFALPWYNKGLALIELKKIQ